MIEPDNPFWNFSIAVYADTEVAAECLTLQRLLNIDVNILLFCAWIGSAKRTKLSDEDLAAVEACARPWHDAVVRPLRDIRAELKRSPAIEDNAVKELRRDVAQIEIRAEQIEQAVLFEMASKLVSSTIEITAGHAIRENVTALLRRNMMRSLSSGMAPPKVERIIAQATAYSLQ